jgi:phosphoribosylamine--glycine ligase
MNTKTGPVVIEFNARFGDPEAMNTMSLFNADAGELIEAMTTGTLDQFTISFAKQATVCIYLVPKGYPENPKSECEIVLPKAYDALMYYANVRLENGHLITGRSRSLAFVGVGETLENARMSALLAASEVCGEVRFRTDIGTAEVLERRMTHMKTLRGDAT